MISIYKRELKSYFSGLFGWCMLAAMSLTCTLIVLLENILSYSANFASAFSALSPSLILFVPILTARTFTRERTLGNFSWLCSLPVRRGALVVGKYLAALSLILLASLPLAVIPPILANFGTVSYGSTYTALLGYLLLAAALTAICALVACKLKSRLASFLCNFFLALSLFLLPLLSTVCELLPWLALLICVGICLLIGTAVGILRRGVMTAILSAAIPSVILALLFLIPNFYTHVFSKLLLALSIFNRLNGFLAGHFDLSAAILLASLAVFFTVLTVLTIGKRKPTLKRFLTDRRTLVAVSLAILLVGCNLLALLLPFRAAYADVSGSTTYRLSDASLRYLSTLEEDIEIVYYSYGGKENADKDLYAFVLRYADASPRIHVRLEDTAKTGASVTDQSVEIRSAKRSRRLLVSDLFYYYNSNTQMIHSLAEYAAVLQMISQASSDDAYKQMAQAYAPGTTAAFFTGEANLTGAIRFAASDRAPVLYAYSKGTSIAINQFLRQQLEQSAFDVRTSSSLSTIPSDCEALSLTLAQDLSAEEAAALSAYLANGGTLVLNTAYTSTNLPNLYAILSAYGLTAPNKTHILYDASTASQLFYAVEGAIHPVTDLFGGQFVAAYAHKIDLWQVEGVTQAVLLQSPETSFCITQNESAPTQGSFPICVLAQKDSSRVLWFSMIPDSYTYGLSGGANGDFTESALLWATDTSTAPLNISDTTLVSHYLSITKTALIAFIAVFMVLLPLLSLAIGGVRFYVRRKK